MTDPMGQDGAGVDDGGAGVALTAGAARRGPAPALTANASSLAAAISSSAQSAQRSDAAELVRARRVVEDPLLDGSGHELYDSRELTDIEQLLLLLAAVCAVLGLCVWVVCPCCSLRGRATKEE